jgi:hypothetical protein
LIEDIAAARQRWSYGGGSRGSRERAADITPPLPAETTAAMANLLNAAIQQDDNQAPANFEPKPISPLIAAQVRVLHRPSQVVLAQLTHTGEYHADHGSPVNAVVVRHFSK